MKLFGWLKPEMSPDWIEDCLKWHGKVLTGAYGHWCGEWDDLPVDNTCPEFACCLCFPDGLHFRIAKWWCRRQYEP